MKETEEQNDVRVKEMAEVIRSCQASGLTITEWCAQNSISEGSYYYWLKKLRELSIQEKNKAGNQNAIVQVDLSGVKTLKETFIRIEYHGCKIELSTGTGYDDIATILKAVKTIC